MLRMLLNREALMISRDGTAEGRVPSGMVAHGAGAFARAISQTAGHIGRASSSEGLYRIVLPTGSLARDLVPAVGGGFRGIVRTAGSNTISGHVRLVPAALGGGAAVAAGPLIAAVGLAVAAEMLTQHQMNKKLTSIASSVQSVVRHLDAQDRAILITADQEARKVAGYLLDQANLPAINGAGHAFGDLASLTNRQLESLDLWLSVAEKHRESERVNGADLMSALIGKREDPIRAFERSVIRTYETLALRARVVVLEKIAAEFSNPDRSLAHVEHALRDELAVLAERQTQLVGLLDDLSALQVDGSRLPVSFAGKKSINMRTSFGRLARALHAAPAPLPMLSEADRTVLELKPNADGLSVVLPAAV
jgi:hypothetical protein